MPARRSRYIHGTRPAEQRRLTRLNALLNDACLRELGLRGGERILDVGAGLCQLSRAMARAAGARVVAVERSAEQRAEAARQARAAGEADLLDLRGGEAEALPLRRGEWGTFDLAHARYLLEHVPDPAAVVAGMVRAVRPGGRIVLADDDHDLLRLFPEPPAVRAAWRAFVRGYDRNGNDPYVGRRLAALLHAAGAAPRRITWIFFGACAGETTFPAFVANLRGNLESARGAIEATGMIDADGIDESLRELASFGKRPDAAIWYAMAWAEGVVRRSTRTRSRGGGPRRAPRLAAGDARPRHG